MCTSGPNNVPFQEGVSRLLFPSKVHSPLLSARQLVVSKLEKMREALSDQDLIREVNSGSFAVASVAMLLSEVCNDLDTLWSLYHHEQRALALYTSRGLTQQRDTSEARVPGGTSFACLVPNTLVSKNIPSSAQQHQSRSAPLDQHAPVPPNDASTGDTGPVTFDTKYHQLKTRLAELLGRVEVVISRPDALGGRTVGQLILSSLKQLAVEIGSTICTLAKIRSSQRRLWIAHVEPATVRTDRASRRPEEVFSALP